MCAMRGSTPSDQKSREIDKLLHKYQSHHNNDVKILLLGPGESGKSTVFKQMKIIQDSGGFTAEERLNFKPVVYSNCISQMRVLVQNAAKLKVPFKRQENLKFAQDLLQLPHAGNVWTPEIGAAIKSLWEDTGIQNVYSQRDSMFQLNDTADYFFSNVDRFLDPNYIPTTADVLRVRVRSTGIEEAEFVFDKMVFKVVDVGGQRSERRKWIHCFSCVTTVLFCASLIGYCQTLREQGNVSRMDEALELFAEVSNSEYFCKSSMILFLNKMDLFREKIKTHPLKGYFTNYDGGDDFDKASKFVTARFVEVVGNGATIYPHITCAINTENIEFVINDVRANVITNITMGIAPHLGGDM